MILNKFNHPVVILIEIKNPWYLKLYVSEIHEYSVYCRKRFLNFTLIGVRQVTKKKDLSPLVRDSKSLARNERSQGSWKYIFFHVFMYNFIFSSSLFRIILKKNSFFSRSKSMKSENFALYRMLGIFHFFANVVIWLYFEKLIIKEERKKIFDANI